MKSYFEIVKAWSDASSLEATDDYLADDFQSLDKDGNVQFDKAAFLGMGAMLYDSFRDFRFVRTDIREEGDLVIMTGHFEGTHVADLDLSAMGMGVIPASGKRIVWPDNPSIYTVAGGKITKEQPLGEGGGMEAFLAPLLGKQPAS